MRERAHAAPSWLRESSYHYGQTHLPFSPFVYSVASQDRSRIQNLCSAPVVDVGRVAGTMARREQSGCLHHLEQRRGPMVPKSFLGLIALRLWFRNASGAKVRCVRNLYGVGPLR